MIQVLTLFILLLTWQRITRKHRDRAIWQ